MNLTLEYDSFQDFASKLWPCLSEEGMWFSSENPAGVGELVDFDVMLADGFRLFHGSGQVIGVGPGPESGPGGQGMTLRFSQLDQPSRNLVRKVVSKHIGEGGKLFVLSTPGTKVEVVGDDEAEAPTGGGESGMGPEDLVAPFAGLEGDKAWSGDSEPDLTSFLQPSGRGMDLEQEAVAPEGEFDFASAATSDEPPTEMPVADADVGSGAEIEQTAGAFAAAADAPEVEPWNTREDEAPDYGFDPALAETQRIEPMESEDLQVEIPLAHESEAPQPLPSTVIPPPLAGYGADDENDDPSTDEFYPHGTSASSGRAWWPWVVVGGLAVGAGLYSLLRMETPLSGLFGKGADTEQAASVSTGAGESAEVSDAGDAVETAADSAPGDQGLEGEPNAVGAETEEVTAEGELEVIAAPDSARPRPGAVVDDAPATDAEPSIPTVTVAQAEDSAGNSSVADTSADPAPAPLRLQRITWREVEGDTVIRLALSGPITDDRFETQSISGDSPRLLLKLHGAAGGVPRDPVTIGSDHVQQLRFGVHNVDGVRQVHAVVDLAGAGVQMVGAVVIDDGAVELRFGRP